MKKEDIRDIKQQFFTYRNGIIADRLREGGDSHKIIFGLNLPQIIEIASKIEKSAELAEFLWTNNTTRESQIIAPMLYPISEFDMTKAKEWISSIPNEEIADVLCHRLLRHTEFAEDLCHLYYDSENDLERYLSFRLAFNIILINKYSNITYLEKIANIELDKNNTVTKQLVYSLLSEIQLRME